MSLADELLADLEGDDDGDFYPDTNGQIESHLDPQTEMDIPMEEGNLIFQKHIYSRRIILI